MMSEFSEFILNFGFNFLIGLILVRFIYYPSTHKKGYVFTFIAFNTVIYFVLSLMASIEIGLGVGFGLFAIFSILRYRTNPMPIREMTYMFIIAALPLMNSVGITSDLWLQLVVANLSVLAVLFVLEREWGFKFETSKRIVYEKMELIQPGKRMDLIKDIQERTGIKVKRLNFDKIDFLHDTATLRIYYDDPNQEGWLSAEDPESVEIVRNESDDD